jgi:hypothetical protein
MNREISLPGVLSHDELVATAESIAALQLSNGMIPWFPGGHCDPWNHVETAMALDTMGFHHEARLAYGWLADIQRSDGSWHNYYLPDGGIEDAKLDTNVCAYVAAGLWHHWLCTGDLSTVSSLWPVARAAIEWVLGLRRADGTVLWAREVDELPWDYALLTGSSSIRHSLRCAAMLAALLDDHPDRYLRAADAIDHVVRTDLSAFAPKERWAMDWYYPVMTGTMEGSQAKDRLASLWDTFVMDGLGVRCVSDEPWVTAAETAECALAHAALGDTSTARTLLSWTRPHRNDDGSYTTGLVHPEGIPFPENERTAYTAAAIILAVDSTVGASPGSRLFKHGGLDR